MTGLGSGDSPSKLRVAAIGIILLGFGLRVFHLGYQELRGDETFGYFFSLPTFRQIIQRTFELQEPHPVASYFIQSFWIDSAGHSEYALRFPSVWFSILAVAIFVRLAYALNLSTMAISASGLLLTASPYAVWHSQDARMYSMSLALTLASSWFFIAMTAVPQASSLDKQAYWLQKPSQRLPLLILGYLSVTLLALHTHYFTAFVVVGQNLFMLIMLLVSRDLRSFLIWIGVQLILGLAYLPWLIPARAILTDYGGNGDSPTLLGMAARTIRTFTFGETIHSAWLWVAVAVAIISLSRQLRANRLRTLYLLTYLLIPLLATWVSSWQRPIFDERYLIAAAPPFLLLLGLGMTARVNAQSTAPTNSSPRKLLRLVEGRLVSGLVILMGLGTIISLTHYYTNPIYSKSIGWRELAQTLEQLSSSYAADSVRLVQNYPDPTLWYYYQGDVEHLVLPPAPLDETGTAREIERLVEGNATGNQTVVEHVILALQPADNWDNDGIAQQALSEEFTLVGETAAANWPIHIYSRAPAELGTVANGDFVNGLHLSHASILPRTAKPGTMLSIHLGWNLGSSLGALELTGTEKLFLHLIGPDGSLIAQSDSMLSHGMDTNLLLSTLEPVANSSDEAAESTVTATPAAIASYGILIPKDAPVGEYSLLGGLYDPELAGAPRILTATGADTIPIAVLMLNP